MNIFQNALLAFSILTLSIADVKLFFHTTLSSKLGPFLIEAPQKKVREILNQEERLIESVYLLESGAWLSIIIHLPQRQRMAVI